MSAGQNVGPLDREARRLFQPPLPPDEATWALAAAAGISTVGLRPSFVIPAAAHSHPDCRAVLILIVAPQFGALYAGDRYGSPVSGGLAGAFCGAGFIWLERFVLRRNAGGLIRPLPFLAYFALRSVLYVGVIVFVIVVVNEAAGAGIAGVRAFDLIAALVSSVGVILFLSVNDLLGPGVLFAFAAGRYHNPRIEERVLLFIDMRASTAIAERLGELHYLSLLNRFVSDVSFAVAEAGGGIHKYVGDEVIATWRLAPGANPPSCVSAAFATLDRIVAQDPRRARRGCAPPQ